MSYGETIKWGRGLGNSGRLAGGVGSLSLIGWSGKALSTHGRRQGNKGLPRKGNCKGRGLKAAACLRSTKAASEAGVRGIKQQELSPEK